MRIEIKSMKRKEEEWGNGLCFNYLIASIVEFDFNDSMRISVSSSPILLKPRLIWRNDIWTQQRNK